MKKVGKYHVYCIGPIDLWHPLPSLSECISDMQANGNHDGATELTAFVEEAKNAVEQSGVGWEGDLSDGSPYVVYLPFDVRARPGAVCIKQANNGTTFVASLIPMPQLD